MAAWQMPSDAIGQWPRRATGAHDRGAQQADSPDWEMKAEHFNLG